MPRACRALSRKKVSRVCAWSMRAIMAGIDSVEPPWPSRCDGSASMTISPSLQCRATSKMGPPSAKAMPDSRSIMTGPRMTVSRLRIVCSVLGMMMPERGCRSTCSQPTPRNCSRLADARTILQSAEAASRKPKGWMAAPLQALLTRQGTPVPFQLPHFGVTRKGIYGGNALFPVNTPKNSEGSETFFANS